jgi:hypothetical protein
VTGTLYQTSSLSSTSTFTLTVTDQCGSATITPATISAQTYYIYSSSLSVTFSAFTSSYSCGSFTYTALCNSAVCPSFISFDSSTLTFTVYSVTGGDAGTYSIVVTGTLSSTSSLSSTSTFVLTVIDPCISATITPATISA